ncbi:hypothetical protein TcBrA4_0072250 [Trypanosoma cruzi]|nr:hypothetical protein TcBrA4_0072250 [Trypanosoma cruzi]
MRAVTTVREDGTYVTSYTPSRQHYGGGSSSDGIRQKMLCVVPAGLRLLITKGDYFVASALAAPCLRLLIRLFTSYGSAVDMAVKSKAQDDALMLLHEIIRYGTAPDAACANGRGLPMNIYVCPSLPLRTHSRRFCRFLWTTPTKRLTLWRARLLAPPLGRRSPTIGPKRRSRLLSVASIHPSSLRS